MAIFAALFTYAARRRPFGPQPASYGHIQTLVNLIDEYPGPLPSERVLYWGHKNSVQDVEKGLNTDDDPTLPPSHLTPNSPAPHSQPVPSAPPQPPTSSSWFWFMRLVHYSLVPFAIIVMGLWHIARHLRDKILTPAATFLRTFFEILTAEESSGIMGEQRPAVYHAGRLII